MSSSFSKLKEVGIPLVVHLLSAMAFLIVCVFVLPAFEHMFADMGATLPALTQMLLDISNWIVDYIFLFVFLFILDVVLLIKFRKHSKMILKVSILSLIGGFTFVGICLYLPISSMAKVVGS